MKKLMIMIGLVSVLVGLNTGCANTYMVGSYNQRHTDALQIEARGGNSAFLGIDLLSLPRGYCGAWADDPGGMTIATALDVALAALGAWAYGQVVPRKERTKTVTVTEYVPVPYPVPADPDTPIPEPTDAESGQE